MACHCSLRNIQGLLADGELFGKDDSGEPFEGPITPLGAVVEYHPISIEGPVKAPTNLVKTCQGYFSDTHWLRWRLWKGDIMVADIEEL